MSSAPTRFVLVRHGEASGNREMRYLGTTDAPLTERGQAQARQLANALALYRPAALYTSPLLRACQTAGAVAAALGLAVVADPRLREEDFGAWENRTRAEVQAADPQRLAAWEAGDTIAPPGGESLAAVRERVAACADALARRHPGETVLLASHVGPIKALVCAALELPAAGARRMWLDPASICVVDWLLDAGGARSTGVLRVFNATAHLDPPARWLEARA
jgi:ribonuclease H / adenosylcobalamin/alpha-ribazole phosphatase